MSAPARVQRAFASLVWELSCAIRDAHLEHESIPKTPPRPRGRSHSIEEGHEWDRRYASDYARRHAAWSRILHRADDLRNLPITIHNCEIDAAMWRQEVLIWVRREYGA